MHKKSPRIISTRGGNRTIALSPFFPYAIHWIAKGRQIITYRACKSQVL